jgi:hypothetical protein
VPASCQEISAFLNIDSKTSERFANLLFQVAIERDCNGAVPLVAQLRTLLVVVRAGDVTPSSAFG